MPLSGRGKPPAKCTVGGLDFVLLVYSHHGAEGAAQKECLPQFFSHSGKCVFLCEALTGFIVVQSILTLAAVEKLWPAFPPARANQRSEKRRRNKPGEPLQKGRGVTTIIV